MGWGFIGAGRATYILLKGFHRAGKLPERIVVSDRDESAFERLDREFGFVNMVKDNRLPAAEDVVFLSVPFTSFEEVLRAIKDVVRDDAVVVSLAPKFRIKEISELLGGFDRVVRMVPNAPSAINMGYNPVCFSESIPHEEKGLLLELFSSLGLCVEVNESRLESYVLVTAASPTYFWFQFVELCDTAKLLGFEEDEANKAVYHMLKGAVELLFNSGLSFEEVIDLVPLKPVAEHEGHIKGLLRESILKVYEKLRTD
ncbi:MAG: NAD(P)-binding domain-containing protein [Deferribacteres bacterium]|nr:NAD(P)-binding domain-containing protein [Deferribacteres bacterium]